MKVSFRTGSVNNLEIYDWELFDYEEKYISPNNGITAYLMKYGRSIDLGKEKIELRSAAGETDSSIVFMHNNLLYTIYGNTSSGEMKLIIDSFIINH